MSLNLLKKGTGSVLCGQTATVIIEKVGQFGGGYISIYCKSQNEMKKMGCHHILFV